MSKKQLVLVAMALAMLTGLLMATPVSAQETPVAETPSMQNPVWYSFDVGRVEDEFDTKVTVSSRDSSTRFQIFTADNFDYWARPEEGDWFGQASCGNSNSDDDEDNRGFTGARWCGNLVPGTYYVHRSGGAAPIGVSGPGVSSLTPIVRGDPAQNVSVADNNENEFAEEHVLIQEGDDVTPTCGTWIENHDGCAKLLWFRVGRLEDELPMVTISMHTEPVDGAGHFQVFTAGNAPCAWETPEEGDWMGVSNETDSDDEYAINNNRWSGQLVPGSYVVRVEPGGADRFVIGVSGKTVTY